MKIRPYLEATQKVALRSFSSALDNNRLSHAYILVGEEGAPLMETAIYLAKSILCDSPDPLADETCRTCQRIDNGNYPDLKIIDGSSDTIKKEAVTDLLAEFRATPLEKKGVLVYVINMIESMTPQAENSLLKFLEEPADNTYAILTTANVTKVLPTILSRAETLRLVLPPKEKLEAEALGLGVDKADAFLLSPLAGTATLLKEMSESDEYLSAKAALELFIEENGRNRPDYAFLFASRFTSEQKGSRGILMLEKKAKKTALLFLSLLEWLFRNCLHHNLGEESSPLAYDIYRGYKGSLDPKKALGLLPDIRRAIDIGVSPSLALDALGFRLNLINGIQ